MRKLLFFILVITGLQVQAQQGLQMDFEEPDSATVALQRQIDYFNLISGTFMPGLLNEDFSLKKYNLSGEFTDPYKFSFELFPHRNQVFGSFSPGTFHTVYSPFLRNAEIFSAAAYKFGDKFTLGGFSYGANSVFTAPFPNQGIGNFESYGSTIFMQYKVSKKFKIETRVNVSQGGRHPGF